MRAFILAGGFATRLWPLMERRAKPLLPLAGRPLITHLVEKIPTDISITVSTNAAYREGFESWRASLADPRVTLVIEESHREDHKLGALGAVADWVLREGIDEDILLLTGDNYLGFSLTHFLAQYHPGTPLLAACDIGSTEKASHFGTVLLDPQQPTHIVGFEEKPKEPKTTLVSTGCSVLPSALLPILVEFATKHPDNVGGIFEELLRRHIPVECFVFTDPWLDIGSFASYLDAHRLLVGSGTLLDPTATTERSSLEGSIAIGAMSHITDSTLHDCIVFDHCDVRDCQLRNCIIDDHCRLQGIDLSDKMLRAGTVLEREGTGK